MTNIDTIKQLESIIEYFEDRIEKEKDPAFDKDTAKKDAEAMRAAIKALEQEPILDKIRAEILEEKDCAYADFERYKVEYLGQDWEDVLDSLPQDDFRYGMERVIEIIDKYKAESEE